MPRPRIIFKFSTDMIPIVMLSSRPTSLCRDFTRFLTMLWPTVGRISGVGSVSILGAPTRNSHLSRPESLEAYNLSVEGISAIIGARTAIFPEDRLTSVPIPTRCGAGRVLGGRPDGPISSSSGRRTGAISNLRDVARIR